MRVVRRRAAFAALGWLALVVACGRDKGAPLDLGIRPVAPYAETTFVSSSTGSPSGPGTRAAPFSSLMTAILSGSTSGKGRRLFLVATGSYLEAVELRSDMIIRGGYDPADWTHAPGRQTDIVGGPATANANNLEVSDIRFLANDAANRGASSIAFIATGCDSNVRFVHCSFIAGNAGKGSDGVDHAGPGAQGDPGQDGSLGGRGGGATVCCRFAANRGGAGGPANDAGADGHSSCAVVGIGGVAGTTATRGGDGTAGAVGAPGANGSGNTSIGSFSNASTWVPAWGASGQDGCAAGGGGGGGGGWTAGGCPPDGEGNGGGGGQGGYPGTAGTGGIGGGVSVALAMVDSSPLFEDCTFVSGHGGDGGRGGSGGDGGAGGAGGAGATSICGTGGGNGGPGGASGAGGGGQGGPGGPSWCIIRFGITNPSYVRPTFVVGTGGVGGTGGLQGSSGPRAAPGPDGPAGIHGPVASPAWLARR